MVAKLPAPVGAVETIVTATVFIVVVAGAAAAAGAAKAVTALVCPVVEAVFATAAVTLAACSEADTFAVVVPAGKLGLANTAVATAIGLAPAVINA